ncbi:unnamed protein product [Calicophoron daubneyi]|uniref:Uncharacterized protein n=1 Tax=Calicophoron daubneyi TaxID=300641 RepID=A0AAV2TUA5_CALDB
MDDKKFLPTTDRDTNEQPPQVPSNPFCPSPSTSTFMEDRQNDVGLLDSPSSAPQTISCLNQLGFTVYRSSPPVGRTTITSAFSPTTGNTECSSMISSQDCPPVHPIPSRTDSGFSSWTGAGDCQKKFPPSLLTDSHYSLSREGDSGLPDISTFATQTTPSLSTLPCANALNEELADRMFVRNPGEISLCSHMHSQGSGNRDKVYHMPAQDENRCNLSGACMRIGTTVSAMESCTEHFCSLKATESNMTSLSFRPLEPPPVNSVSRSTKVALRISQPFVQRPPRSLASAPPTTCFPTVHFTECISETAVSDRFERNPSAGTESLNSNGGHEASHRIIPQHKVTLQELSPRTAHTQNCGPPVGSLHHPLTAPSNSSGQTTSHWRQSVCSCPYCYRQHRPGSAPLHGTFSIEEEEEDNELADNEGTNTENDGDDESDLIPHKPSQSACRRCLRGSRHPIRRVRQYSYQATQPPTERGDEHPSGLLGYLAGNSEMAYSSVIHDLQVSPTSENQKCYTEQRFLVGQRHLLRRPQPLRVPMNGLEYAGRTATFSDDAEEPVCLLPAQSATPDALSPPPVPPPMPDVVPRQALPLRFYQTSPSTSNSVGLLQFTAVTRSPHPLFGNMIIPTPRCASVPLNVTDSNLIVGNAARNERPLGAVSLRTRRGLSETISIHDAHVCGSLSRHEQLSLLARQMARIGDEMDAQYERGRHSLPTNSFFRDVNDVQNSLRHFSSSLASLVTSPFDCVHRILQFVSQSVSGASTNEPNSPVTFELSDQSTATSNSNQRRRRRTRARTLTGHYMPVWPAPVSLSHSIYHTTQPEVGARIMIPRSSTFRLPVHSSTPQRGLVTSMSSSIPTVHSAVSSAAEWTEDRAPRTSSRSGDVFTFDN